MSESQPLPQMIIKQDEPVPVLVAFPGGDAFITESTSQLDPEHSLEIEVRAALTLRSEWSMASGIVAVPGDLYIG